MSALGIEPQETGHVKQKTTQIPEEERFLFKKKKERKKIPNWKYPERSRELQLEDQLLIYYKIRLGQLLSNFMEQFLGLFQILLIAANFRFAQNI